MEGENQGKSEDKLLPRLQVLIVGDSSSAYELSPYLRETLHSLVTRIPQICLQQIDQVYPSLNTSQNYATGTDNEFHTAEETGDLVLKFEEGGEHIIFQTVKSESGPTEIKQEQDCQLKHEDSAVVPEDGNPLVEVKQACQFECEDMSEVDYPQSRATAVKNECGEEIETADLVLKFEGQIDIRRQDIKNEDKVFWNLQSGSEHMSTPPPET